MLCIKAVAALAWLKQMQDNHGLLVCLSPGPKLTAVHPHSQAAAHIPSLQHDAQLTASQTSPGKAQLGSSQPAALGLQEHGAPNKLCLHATARPGAAGWKPEPKMGRPEVTFYFHFQTPGKSTAGFIHI